VSYGAQQEGPERALLLAAGKEAHECLLKELANKKAAAEANVSMTQVRHIDCPPGKLGGSSFADKNL
jgi:hypothetical protein